MKIILVAVAIATSPTASVEETEIAMPAHLVTMCKAEDGCALVTKKAMSELSIRMFVAGAASVSGRKGCGA